MRRFCFLILITLFVLVACENSNVPTPVLNNENTISESKLTDRERGILATTADQSFVYDFSVDNEYSHVSVWIEKYEFGKLVSEKPNDMKTEIEGKGTLIFSTVRMVDDQNRIMFQIGVQNDSSSSVGKSIESTPEDPSHEFMSVWGTTVSGKQQITPNMVLGTISYKKGEGNMQTLSSDFYKDEEAIKAELEPYDVVFLLRANFTK